VLTDINSIGNTNLNAVSGFSLGFGVRCTWWSPYFDEQEVNSVVMFDNIRLYGSTCVPGKGPTADMDGDCDVDMNDMDALADDWLTHAENLTPAYSPPSKAPILWYKFDNATGTEQNSITADSGTGDANNYQGTIQAFIAQNWKAGLGRNGQTCLYLLLGNGNWVSVPSGPTPTTPEVMGFMGDGTHATAGGGGISFSIWINADTTSNYMLTSWNGLYGVWNGASTTETLEVHCPAPLKHSVDPSGPRTNFIKRTPAATASAFNMHVGDYGGKWNHWAMTKSDYSMKVYCNGVLQGQTDANGEPNDPNKNVFGPLFDPNVGAVRVGTRGTNWGQWAGYINDFQIYDYCLSDAEVAYLATDGSGSIFIPLVSPANINKDGSTSPLTDVNQIVDFRDLAIMGKQWHTIQLWP